MATGYYYEEDKAAYHAVGLGIFRLWGELTKWVRFHWAIGYLLGRQQGLC